MLTRVQSSEVRDGDWRCNFDEKAFFEEMHVKFAHGNRIIERDTYILEFLIVLFQVLHTISKQNILLIFQMVITDELAKNE